MIKYFSTGVFSRYVGLLIFVVICWIPSFVNPVASTSPHISLIPELASLSKTFPISGLITSFIAYIFSVLFLNLTAVKQHLTGLISLTPAFFYIVITATLSYYFSSNIYILISLLLMVVIYYSLTLHERDNSIKNAFNAGFFLGISSLIYPPLVYLFLVIWISILLHRDNNWRAFVSSIMGLVAPFVFLLTWFFLNDQFHTDVEHLKSALIPDFSFPIWSLHETIVFVLILITGLAISLNVLYSLTEKSINLRRNLLVLVFLFLFIVVITLMFDKSMSVFMLVAIPMAMMSSNLAPKLRKNKWINRGLVVIIVAAIVIHLIDFLNVT